MKSLLHCFILLCLATLINSCNICTCKKVPCLPFEDANFQSWFAAYDSDQRIIFKYQSSYDTVSLSNAYKSEAYEASQGCYHGDSGCHKNFSVHSSERSATSRRKLSLNYGSETPFGSAESMKSISLFVNGFDCKASDVNDQGLVLVPGIYNGNYTAVLTLNGVTYNNVQTITRDTTIDLSSPMPFKVYLSKGSGVIAYEMYPGHEVWVKQ